MRRPTTFLLVTPASSRRHTSALNWAYPAGKGAQMARLLTFEYSSVHGALAAAHWHDPS